MVVSEIVVVVIVVVVAVVSVTPDEGVSPAAVREEELCLSSSVY